MNILDNPAWFNGNFCTIQDLNFNVLDLGVIHCDASYDVACSSNRKIFLLDQHIERFFSSCKGLRLPLVLKRSDVSDIIIELCKRSNLDSLLIWMGITRGVPLSGNPRDLKNTTPNLFFYVKPYYDFGKSEEPISLCLSSTLRTPDSSVNQQYKNWAWIDLTAAQWEAIDLGYDSAVLTSTDGYITEGPGFAVWGITGNTVVAPKLNCLPSVTIFALEKVCQLNNIAFEYRNLTVTDFKNLDFVGIASTSGGIKAVSKFEKQTYCENEIYSKLLNLIKEKHYDNNWTTQY